MTTALTVRHYHWAGLDFLIDAAGHPVLIEANRSSHMLGEYLHFLGNDRPFALTAAVMNRAPGAPCVMLRPGETLDAADECAGFIARRLQPHLDRELVPCNVDSNQDEREELLARDGRRVRPGSIFRWWYGLPWSYERAGITVINPNAAWVAVRDKLAAGATLAQARLFRVPRSYAVDSIDQAHAILADHREHFSQGFVIKPRVGWGGQGVQIGEPGDVPGAVEPGSLLSERIVSRTADGRFHEVRAFVMAGQYLGGIRHCSRTPATNYWQGGRPERLDDETMALLEPAALEAVALLDAAADAIARLPYPPQSELTRVAY